MAEMAEISSSAPTSARKLKLMELNDSLRLHLANIIHADFVDPEAKFNLVLFPIRTRNKPEHFIALTNFLHTYMHPSCVDRTIKASTVTQWVEALKEIGVKENLRLINDAAAGRNSELEVLPEYVAAWADLMQLYDDAKNGTIKTTRYTRVPDHLVGKVELLNSALCPAPPGRRRRATSEYATAGARLASMRHPARGSRVCYRRREACEYATALPYAASEYATALAYAASEYGSRRAHLSARARQPARAREPARARKPARAHSRPLCAHGSRRAEAGALPTRMGARAGAHWSARGSQRVQESQRAHESRRADRRRGHRNRRAHGRERARVRKPARSRRAWERAHARKRAHSPSCT